MTYTVSSGTLNSTIPYHTIRHISSGSRCFPESTQNLPVLSFVHALTDDYTPFSGLAVFTCATQLSAVIATATWLAGWVAVCHSRYCIKTTKPILKCFPPPDSPIIGAFGTPYADTKFQGEPLHRGRLIHGGRKNWRFSTEMAVYLGNGAR